ALAFWVAAARHEPQVPLSVQALFRPQGDIQYFPVIAALAHASLRDPTVLEFGREGVTGVPVASLLPHAVCFALLGPVGLAVADALVALAFFLAVVLLLRLLGVPSLLARCLGLVVATPAGSFLSHQFALVQSLPNIQFWAFRIPRPFVTSVFVVLMLATTVAVVRSRASQTNARVWAWWGLCTSLVIQSDPYAAFGLVPLVPLVMVGVLHDERGASRHFWGRCLAFGVAATLSGLPFLLQRA